MTLNIETPMPVSVIYILAIAAVLVVVLVIGFVAVLVCTGGPAFGRLLEVFQIIF